VLEERFSHAHDEMSELRVAAERGSEIPGAAGKSILLVDDRDFERFAIRAAVEGLTDFHVCGEARNGVEAVEKAAELKPDLVIMDLAMPLMNGLEAAKILKDATPEVSIVLLTLYADEEHGPTLRPEGVAKVLSKVDGLGPLLTWLRQVPAAE
jgi:DNA-binding NarL/FixJ family response regulator